MPESQLHEARLCRSARFGQPGRLGGLFGTPFFSPTRCAGCCQLRTRRVPLILAVLPTTASVLSNNYVEGLWSNEWSRK